MSGSEGDAQLDAEGLVVRDVTNAIRQQLSPQELDIKADVGCGGIAKLEIFIVSDQFEGLPLLKRHKLVQAAVRTIHNYEGRVHAITISKSLTPAQFESSKKA